MAFFEFHIDRDLAPLGGGTLPPRRFRRLVRHARNCHRCAALYERAIRVLRQLEHQSPFVPAQVEVDSLTALNLPPRMRFELSPRWAFGFLGVTVAVALVLLNLPRAQPDDAFAVRGGPGAAQAVLRVFCGGHGAALTEVREATSCSVGQSLAFAAGAATSHAQVVLQVRGSATSESSIAAVVTTPPGAESPVALTAELEREGTVEVVAAFAPDADQASAAARGERVAGVLVLRRTVKVVP
jgi:hypothetical protein